MVVAFVAWVAISAWRDRRCEGIKRKRWVSWLAALAIPTLIALLCWGEIMYVPFHARIDWEEVKEAAKE
jgi:hypothetical protein